MLPGRALRAFTSIELLLVLVLLLGVLGWFIVRGSSRVPVAARKLAQELTLERQRAVAAGLRSTCWRGRDAIVAAAPVRGLMFTPDGLPRTCDGGGVGNTTILLEHRGRRAAVIVSSLGRVRWELR